MLIGVVSDTHGQTDYTLDAVRMLETFDVDAVLHCGDVGGAEIVELFKRWPTYFVFGNVDDPRSLRRAIAAAGQTCCEYFGSLELSGVKIAILHGDDTARLAAASKEGYGLVCHGHTHVAKQIQVGDTIVLNPGALYRATPHSLAIVELPARRIEIISV